MRRALDLPATVPARAAVSWLGQISDQAPEISWYGDVQPVPLHRVRVTVGRRGGQGFGYNREDDAIYRQDLQVLWRASGIHQPLEGMLAVVMTFAGSSKSNRRQPDMSNLIKAVEDAGNGVLWTDDRQIVLELGWIRAWGKDIKPLVTLDVWRLPDGHHGE